MIDTKFCPPLFSRVSLVLEEIEAPLAPQEPQWVMIHIMIFSVPAFLSSFPFHLLLNSLCYLQGPPATIVQPLPIREGKRKRRRHSDQREGAAPSRGEDLSMEEFLQGDQPLEDAEGMEEVFATLSSMKTDVELMRRPLGTFESPARTCKELMMVQPDYKDG